MTTRVIDVIIGKNNVTHFNTFEETLAFLKTIKYKRDYQVQFHSAFQNKGLIILGSTYNTIGIFNVSLEEIETIKYFMSKPKKSFSNVFKTVCEFLCK